MIGDSSRGHHSLPPGPRLPRFAHLHQLDRATILHRCDGSRNIHRRTSAPEVRVPLRAAAQRPQRPLPRPRPGGKAAPPSAGGATMSTLLARAAEQVPLRCRLARGARHALRDGDKTAAPPLTGRAPFGGHPLGQTSGRADDDRLVAFKQEVQAVLLHRRVEAADAGPASVPQTPAPGPASSGSRHRGIRWNRTRPLKSGVARSCCRERRDRRSALPPDIARPRPGSQAAHGPKTVAPDSPRPAPAWLFTRAPDIAAPVL